MTPTEKTPHNIKQRIALYVSHDDFIQLDRILATYSSSRNYQITTKDGEVTPFDSVDSIFSHFNFAINPITRIEVNVDSTSQKVCLRLNQSTPYTVIGDVSGPNTEKLIANLKGWVAEIKQPQPYSVLAMTIWPLSLVIVYCGFIIAIVLISFMLVLFGIIIGQLPASSFHLTGGTALGNFIALGGSAFLFVVGILIQYIKRLFLPQVVFDIGYGKKRYDRAVQLQQWLRVLIAFLIGIFSAIFVANITK